MTVRKWWPSHCTVVSAQHASAALALSRRAHRPSVQVTVRKWCSSHCTVVSARRAMAAPALSRRAHRTSVQATIMAAVRLGLGVVSDLFRADRARRGYTRQALAARVGKGAGALGARGAKKRRPRLRMYTAAPCCAWATYPLAGVADSVMITAQICCAWATHPLAGAGCVPHLLAARTWPAGAARVGPSREGSARAPSRRQQVPPPTGSAALVRGSRTNELLVQGMLMCVVVAAWIPRPRQRPSLGSGTMR